MTLEYHYPIDFPPLETLVDLEACLAMGRSGRQGFWPSQGFLRPGAEQLGWPVAWIHYFYKNSRTGTIHSDCQQEVRPCDDSHAWWAINWVITGQGFIEFWEPEDIDALIPESQTEWYRDTSCLTQRAPRRHYLQVQGQAYLLNAGSAHRTGCKGVREVISIRPPRHWFDQPWRRVCRNFGLELDD